MNNLSDLEKAYQEQITEKCQKNAEHLERLMENESFKALILDHYCGAYTAQLTSFLGTDTEPSTQTETLIKLRAIAELQVFFRSVENLDPRRHSMNDTESEMDAETEVDGD